MKLVNFKINKMKLLKKNKIFIINSSQKQMIFVLYKNKMKNWYRKIVIYSKKKVNFQNKLKIMIKI